MTRKEHGGNIYRFVREKHISPESILDFSANINPLGISPKGREALYQALPEIIHYPDPEQAGLFEAVSLKYHVQPEQILFGNGAAELIFALCRLEGLEEAVIPDPAFSEYEEGARSVGLTVRRLCLPVETGFTFTAELLPELKARTIVFLGNPNNPDGQLLPSGEVEKLIDRLRSTDSLLLVDESFIDFTDSQASARSLLDDYPQLIILHSFTKFYAVPGLRIGALYAAPEIVRQLARFIPTWSVNRLAQAYMQGALADTAYSTSSRDFIAHERQRIYEAYCELPDVKPYLPAANFMLIHWLGSAPVMELQQFLAEHHILIRSCANYDSLGADWFRIAIKASEQNDQLLALIRKFIYNHKK